MDCLSQENVKQQRTYVRRAQSRFIQIDEDCIDKLSLHAMAVYQQLRLLTDFSKDCDEIEITVAALARRSKMSERKVYDTLNELEYTHFLIQRLNLDHMRYGKKNVYNVARDYNFFKPAQDIYTPARDAACARPVDKRVQSLDTPARDAGTPARGAVLYKESYSFHKNNNINIPPKVLPLDEEEEALACREDVEKALAKVKAAQKSVTQSVKADPDKPLYEQNADNRKNLQNEQLSATVDDLAQQTLSQIRHLQNLDKAMNSYNQSSFARQKINMDLRWLQEENVDEQLLNDYLLTRKKPLTVTAWHGLKRELLKCKDSGISVRSAFVEMIERGWNTCKAEWLSNVQSKNKYDDSDMSWASEESWSKNMFSTPPSQLYKICKQEGES